MKTTIFILFFLVAGISVNAQDLLITTKGDTLNCKITKENNDYVYFTFKKNEEIRNTLVEKKQIQVVRKNYFDQPEVSSEEIKNVSPATHNPLKIGLSGGWGRRTSKMIDTDIEQTNYLNGLRSGLQLSLDLDYYFNNYFGVGIKYSLFNASTSGRMSDKNMKDNTTIHFIGPTFASRFMNASKKNAFIMNVSLGYLGYVDSGDLDGQPLRITAPTFGTVLDFGYEIGLSPNIALTFQASSLVGSFSKMKVSANGQSQTTSLQDDQRESLNRIDLSAGIRFYLNKN